ncbi:LLM class flavin-dependent oxidoreductase [Nonomuraea sp. NPDC049152]|uniref:LLM class flavin-dependent oxidoreductase n=1 Tax=Nonomuraea sp. NPDC049152 TaxID=3154350 RepID=UPI0033D3BB1B
MGAGGGRRRPSHTRCGATTPTVNPLTSTAGLRSSAESRRSRAHHPRRTIKPTQPSTRAALPRPTGPSPTGPKRTGSHGVRHPRPTGPPRTRPRVQTSDPLAGRIPANTAMTALTMDILSESRLLLGLGVSVPWIVEGWHGVPYRKPLGRTREYVEILRKERSAATSASPTTASTTRCHTGRTVRSRR